MQKNLIRSALTLACLTMLLVPGPVQAQSLDLSVGVRTNTTTASPGSSVGVFAWVQNNSTSRLRVTTWFTSSSPCGTETMISGQGRVALNGGQGIQVTVGYPLPPDACKGVYAIVFHAKSGAKGSAESTAVTYVTVQ